MPNPGLDAEGLATTLKAQVTKEKVDEVDHTATLNFCAGEQSRSQMWWCTFVTPELDAEEQEGKAEPSLATR